MELRFRHRASTWHFVNCHITINVNQYVTGVNTFTNTIYVIAAQSSLGSFSSFPFLLVHH
jgi:hypothetical protein